MCILMSTIFYVSVLSIITNLLVQLFLKPESLVKAITQEEKYSSPEGKLLPLTFLTIVSHKQKKKRKPVFSTSFFIYMFFSFYPSNHCILLSAWNSDVLFANDPYNQHSSKIQLSTMLKQLKEHHSFHLDQPKIPYYVLKIKKDKSVTCLNL